MTEMDMEFINKTLKGISEIFNKMGEVMDIMMINIKEFSEAVSKIREEDRT